MRGLGRDVSRMVSVIIPARDEGHAFRYVLESLARQTAPTTAFEAVIVDDGSRIPLSQLVLEYKSRLQIRLHRSEVSCGRSVARNQGLRAAAGDILLFADGDCYLDRHLVERHLDRHVAAAAPRVVIGRRYELDWRVLHRVLHGEDIDAADLSPYHDDFRTAMLHAEPSASDWVYAPWAFAFTHNVSVDRDTVDAVGGFDESFTGWGHEDVELFYRAYLHHARSAAVFEVAWDCLVYHMPSVRDLAWQHHERATNDDRFLKKHPRFDVEFFDPALGSPHAAKRVKWFVEAVNQLVEIAPIDEAFEPTIKARELWIGVDTAKSLKACRDLVTFDYLAPPGSRNFHLVGLRTPFPDRAFERVVSIDFWRLLDWPDFSRFVYESLRIAPSLVLVYSRAKTQQEKWPIGIASDYEYVIKCLRRLFVVDVDDVSPTQLGICVRLPSAGSSGLAPPAESGRRAVLGDDRGGGATQPVSA